MVIAIDGPGGVGKSTVARTVADRLGVAYLDTGATYRAATLAVLVAGVDPGDASAVLDVVERVSIGYGSGTVYLDGVDVATAVRSPEVTENSSVVSAHPAVRTGIVEFQRQWVARHGNHAVVEGRDIGTVVFPDTPAKVFLTARPEVRARRRHEEWLRTGHDETYEEVLESLRERDARDENRSAAPLKPASDSILLDSSDLSIQQVVTQSLELVTRARGRGFSG